MSFGSGEETLHLGSGAAHRRATCITGTSGTAAVGRTFGWERCVKDMLVKQEPRTLDPGWRDSAGRAQKENNGSRRPYI